MTNMTKALAKGTLGTIAAGAMVVSSATPAFAQDRHRDRDRGGPSAGEVIAGVVILGGLAAILASSNNDDRRYRDRDYDRDYERDRLSRAERAVEQCVQAAERQAQRRSGSRAEVYEIRDVDRERGGFEVKGRIAVRDGRRDRGWNDRNYRGNDRRGYRGNDNWDEGRFTCDYRGGRVVNIDFNGIRRI